MRTRIAVAALILAAAAPTAATAHVDEPVQVVLDGPSPHLIAVYSQTWSTVRFSTRFKAGANLVRTTEKTGRQFHAATYKRSIRVLDEAIAVERQLDTPPPPAQATFATDSAPSGGLMACIISHESSGNPQAVNGQYSGIGQWNANSWAQFGGTKYASSPTGATYQQQVSVLAAEGPAGMRQQQAQYDHC